MNDEKKTSKNLFSIPIQTQRLNPHICHSFLLSFILKAFRFDIKEFSLPLQSMNSFFFTFQLMWKISVDDSFLWNFLAFFQGSIPFWIHKHNEMSSKYVLCMFWLNYFVSFFRSFSVDWQAVAKNLFALFYFPVEKATAKKNCVWNDNRIWIGTRVRAARIIWTILGLWITRVIFFMLRGRAQ